MSAKTKTTSKDGLLPTPPLPRDLARVQLTSNARQVLERRYIRRGQNGKPAETPDEMFWRVANHVAKVEDSWGGDVAGRAREFYALLSSRSFFPNSPTFTGAGTPLGQLAACFVLPIGDDMGREAAGIFQTLRDAALIQQTGGGNGFGFARLRPKGSLVQASAGRATAPSAGCCGFAGDRGFLVPELTASATEAEARDVAAFAPHDCYSTSRTCEIGLSRATGRPWRSVLHLIEETTRPE